jgi:HD superfamily phosphohydrolase
MKLIRDPIHGYIRISDKLLQIISSPIFQRLRYIKQTGLAYLVYPGMNHTRFEHSIGVMNLSKEFTRFINENSNVSFITDEFIELIGLAGLLHDIGHMPFSHTFENALILAKDVYGMNIYEEGKKTHVKLGEKIIGEYLSDLIDKNFSESVSDPVRFLQRVMNETPDTNEEKFATLIISNFVDADRGDYLLRDSYYAGVSYGEFDVERLKRFLVFIDGKIAILSKAVPIVEQFLLSRMYMYENVYFHSVVGLYNAIISHAIVKLIEKDLTIPDNEKDFEKFTDYLVISKLYDIDDKLRDAILFRKGFTRVKKDITGQCFDEFTNLKQELYKDMRESNGLFIYHEFNDVPYYEEKDDAVFVFDGNEVNKLTSISLIARSLKEIKKAIIGFHYSEKDKVEKYIRKLQECSTVGP